MLNQFQTYLEEQQLIVRGKKILLAVSGGVDSMVMWHLFDVLNLPYAVAHCNFHLRSSESDSDESLVLSNAERLGVVCHKADLYAADFANEKGVSIEMAAREMRYEWFSKLCEEHNYHRVAVAHHSDDVLETFFLNLSRSTGIRGLSGIKNINGNIIRPLLFASQQEVIGYALKHGVEYRNDSSNNDLVYHRNRVRHHIIPELEHLNGAFRKNMLRSITNLSEVEQIYLQKVEEERNRLVVELKDQLLFDIEKMQMLSPLHTYLFEWLKPYGFRNSVVVEIIESLDGDSGKMFFSDTHQINKDRNHLILTDRTEKSDQRFYIEKSCSLIEKPIELKLTTLGIDQFELVRSSRVACIDADLIDYPLVLRKWQKGEYFQPLGMKGFKKVSDFYIDQKLSLAEKENTWIISHGKKIVWIVGHRLDDRFKVTSKTERVLMIRYQ